MHLLRLNPMLRYIYCYNTSSYLPSFFIFIYFVFVQTSRKKTQNIYSESLPVNCALEMRRRPPSIYASTGTVMQKAKVPQSMFSTLIFTLISFLNAVMGRFLCQACHQANRITAPLSFVTGMGVKEGNLREERSWKRKKACKNVTIVTLKG